jgi:hypothetical protein
VEGGGRIDIAAAIEISFAGERGVCRRGGREWGASVEGDGLQGVGGGEVKVLCEWQRSVGAAK